MPWIACSIFLTHTVYRIGGCDDNDDDDDSDDDDDDVCCVTAQSPVLDPLQQAYTGMQHYTGTGIFWFYSVCLSNVV